MFLHQLDKLRNPQEVPSNFIGSDARRVKKKGGELMLPVLTSAYQQTQYVDALKKERQQRLAIGRALSQSPVVQELAREYGVTMHRMAANLTTVLLDQQLGGDGPPPSSNSESPFRPRRSSAVTNWKQFIVDPKLLAALAEEVSIRTKSKMDQNVSSSNKAPARGAGVTPAPKQAPPPPPPSSDTRASPSFDKTLPNQFREPRERKPLSHHTDENDFYVGGMLAFLTPQENPFIRRYEKHKWEKEQFALAKSQGMVKEAKGNRTLPKV